MAYYDALIAFWPSAPPGTTQSKLDWVNAQVVSGGIPPTFTVTGSQLMNALDFAEFSTLTAQQQSNILQICNMPSVLGGANTFVGKLFGSYYASMLNGTTIAAFVALAKATVTPWWKANNYPRPFDMGDIQAAGLS